MVRRTAEMDQHLRRSARGQAAGRLARRPLPVVPAAVGAPGVARPRLGNADAHAQECARGAPTRARRDRFRRPRFGSPTQHPVRFRPRPADRPLLHREVPGGFSADVAGSLLEVGDDGYSRRFGGSRVTQQDVLHVHPGNLQATIVGDLAEPGLLPDNSFDCMIITQTLQLVLRLQSRHYRTARSAEARRGSVLTVPSISQLDVGEAGSTWYWTFTPLSMMRMFCEEFGSAATPPMSSATSLPRRLLARWRPRRWIAPSCRVRSDLSGRDRCARPEGAGMTWPRRNRSR